MKSVFGGNNTIAGFEDTIRPLAPLALSVTQPCLICQPSEQGWKGLTFTGSFCFSLQRVLSDEVKEKVGAAIKHVAGIKGFKSFMKKNNLGAFLC